MGRGTAFGYALWAKAQNQLLQRRTRHSFKSLPYPLKGQLREILSSAFIHQSTSFVPLFTMGHCGEPNNFFCEDIRDLKLGRCTWALASAVYIQTLFSITVSLNFNCTVPKINQWSSLGNFQFVWRCHCVELL
jgi:hypothetical protein